MANERILIIDDEGGVAESLRQMLLFEGYSVETAGGAAEAQAWLARGFFDVALIDLQMPAVNGLEMLEICRRIDPTLPALILTAYGTVEAAARALRLGAKDFLAKPVRRDDLLAAVHRALDASRLSREARALVRQVRGNASFGAIIGRSPKLTAQLDLAARVAPSEIPVVINGETGTGKDLLAAAIHEAGARASRLMVTAVVAAGPGELQKGALFGHVAGAFTGAVAARRGFFQEAHQSTLFLDELGDISLDSQVALLRAVERKSILPVGADREVAVDVRILSATHRDLPREIREGRFRQDLYYRLGGIFLEMPSLRDRPEDIPLLAAHFARRCAGPRRALPEIDPEALEAMCAYRWPGNVRELKNVIERAMLLSEGGLIRPEHCLLQPSYAGGGAEADTAYDQPLKCATRQFTTNYLRRLLSRFQGDRHKVADHAGIHVTHVRRLMRDLGLTEREEGNPASARKTRKKNPLG
jgi:DNA-binding NtrC family response regulator